MRAKETYEYLKELFEEYKKLLFEEFQTASLRELADIKTKIDAINSLERLILSHIQAGSLAREEIDELREDEDGSEARAGDS